MKSLARKATAALLLAWLVPLASAQQDMTPREAHRLARERQSESRKAAKRAQKQAFRQQKENEKALKQRDRERMREAKRITKEREKQGDEIEARSGQPAKTKSDPKPEGPSRDQPDPLERLRNYSESSPDQ